MLTRLPLCVKSPPRETYNIDSQPVLDWLQQDYWKGKKYFGLRVEYLKQEMRHMNLDIHKINGKFNPAAILTKPVPGSLFKKLLVIRFEATYRKNNSQQKQNFSNYVACWKY